MGANNFIVRGSEFSQFLNTLTLLSVLQSADLDGDGDGGGDDDDILQNILDILNTDFPVVGAEHRERRTPVRRRAALRRDQGRALFSTGGPERSAAHAAASPARCARTRYPWTSGPEAVTYIDDPEIREIALGGPDTTTRLRVRHRVRVAQGGELPQGNGAGDGTLATEGNYTAQANRLYRVEIDTAGDIGTATFRWSEDNASTLQRVIAPIPFGSTRVVVEDAAAFHPGEHPAAQRVRRRGARDRRGLRQHDHAQGFYGRTAGAPARGQPGADFTTFALEDRPMVQRWNAFKILIEPDPSDPTRLPRHRPQRRRAGALRWPRLAPRRRLLELQDALPRRRRGVRHRSRHPDRAARLQRPRGVVHHFAPLATITRDGSADEPDKIFLIQDRRLRVGNASTSSGPLANLTGLSGTAAGTSGRPSATSGRARQQVRHPLVGRSVPAGVCRPTTRRSPSASASTTIR